MDCKWCWLVWLRAKKMLPISHSTFFIDPAIERLIFPGQILILFGKIFRASNIVFFNLHFDFATRLNATNERIPHWNIQQFIWIASLLQNTYYMQMQLHFNNLTWQNYNKHTHLLHLIELIQGINYLRELNPNVQTQIFEFIIWAVHGLHVK